MMKIYLYFAIFCAGFVLSAVASLLWAQESIPGEQATTTSEMLVERQNNLILKEMRRTNYILEEIYRKI